MLHGIVSLDATVTEDDDPMRELRDVGFVRHHDDRQAAGIQVLKDLHDLDRCPAVEIAGRLVGKKQRGPIYERPGDGDPLLLTTWKSWDGKWCARSANPTTDSASVARAARSALSSRVYSVGSSAFSNAVVRASR